MESAASDEPLSLTRSTLHAHISILGFDVSIPPADKSEHRDPNAELFTLLGNGQTPVPVITRHLPAFEPLLHQLDAVALKNDTFDQVGRSQVSAPPLCDCARFERSGVLLI